MGELKQVRSVKFKISVQRILESVQFKCRRYHCYYWRRLHAENITDQREQDTERPPSQKLRLNKASRLLPTLLRPYVYVHAPVLYKDTRVVTQGKRASDFPPHKTRNTKIVVFHCARKLAVLTDSLRATRNSGNECSLSLFHYTADIFLRKLHRSISNGLLELLFIVVVEV